MIATRPPGLAESALIEQIEIVGDSSISLDSLWRAAGCPVGREPHAWITLARSLLEGFADYFASLPRGGPLHPADRPLLWTWDAEHSEPWRAGDLMTNALVARVYAAYLDDRLPLLMMNLSNHLGPCRSVR
jgi:hypothetical protein